MADRIIAQSGDRVTLLDGRSGVVERVVINNATRKQRVWVKLDGNDEASNIPAEQISLEENGDDAA